MRAQIFLMVLALSGGLAPGEIAPPPRLGLPSSPVIVTAADTSRTSGKEGRPSCISLWAEARYRNYGYDPIVHLASRCPVEVPCSVSTDVSPAPIEVVLEPNARVEVLTFRGSPQSSFTPYVTCRAAASDSPS